MQLYILAAVAATAFAVPEITSSGNDLNIMADTISFSEMAGTSNNVNREFKITSSDIQFSSDSADTYNSLVAAIAAEAERQRTLMGDLSDMQDAFDDLMADYEAAKQIQSEIDSAMTTAIANAQANLEALQTVTDPALQAALSAAQADVSSTTNISTSLASDVNAAIDDLEANGLFDGVKTRSKTAFDSAKTSFAAITTRQQQTLDSYTPRGASITSDITMFSQNFSTYGPSAVSSIMMSTKRATDLAADYVGFVNAELAAADTVLPRLQQVNREFATTNRTLRGLISTNYANYKRQLEVFRPIIKSIYGGSIRQEISPDVLDTYDYYGEQVAAEGNTMLAGAYGYNGYRSAIFVYEFTDSQGFGSAPSQIINYPGGFTGETTPQTFTYFGQSLDIEGDRFVTGAWGFDTISPRYFSCGRAFIYKKGTDGKWALETALENPDPTSSDEFGRAVQISDGVVYVAAPGDDSKAGVTNHGTIYVYTIGSDGKYGTRPTTTLIDNDATSSDSLVDANAALAVRGNIIAAGAAFGEGTTTGSSHGEVVVWERNGTKFTQIQKFIGSDVASSDNFGTSTHLSELADGTLVMAVGTVGDDNTTAFGSSASSSGAVYIFEKKPTSTKFVETQLLRATERASFDYFGRTVAFSPDGSTLLVTANGADKRTSTGGTVYSVGAVSRFARNAQGRYVEVAALEAKEEYVSTDSSLLFGSGLAATENYIAIGARGADIQGTSSGAVYAFWSGGDL